MEGCEERKEEKTKKDQELAFFKVLLSTLEKIFIVKQTQTMSLFTSDVGDKITSLINCMSVWVVKRLIEMVCKEKCTKKRVSRLPSLRKFLIWAVSAILPAQHVWRCLERWIQCCLQSLPALGEHLFLESWCLLCLQSSLFHMFPKWNLPH